MAEGSYLDRPQDDGTRKAHPAYWRGRVSGVRTALQIIKNIIDDVDNGQGVNKSPQVEAVRRAVLEYKNALKNSTSKSSEHALTEAKKAVANIKL